MPQLLKAIAEQRRSTPYATYAILFYIWPVLPSTASTTQTISNDKGLTNAGAGTVCMVFPAGEWWGKGGRDMMRRVTESELVLHHGNACGDCIYGVAIFILAIVLLLSGQGWKLN